MGVRGADFSSVTGFMRIVLADVIGLVLDRVDPVTHILLPSIRTDAAWALEWRDAVYHARGWALR